MRFVCEEMHFYNLVKPTQKQVEIVPYVTVLLWKNNDSDKSAAEILPPDHNQINKHFNKNVTPIFPVQKPVRVK